MPSAVRPTERFTLIQTEAAVRRQSFADDVAEGLSAEAMSLPCQYLYDAVGSQLFEQICELPEYYPTRCEAEILEAHADAIAAAVPAPVTLVELGSGSSVKTRHLIEALLDRDAKARYVPIDISTDALDQGAQALLEDYAGLSITGVAGEYHEGLRHLDRDLGETKRKLILWLGSSIGNLDQDHAVDFLRQVRATMTGEDRLLLGADLRKDVGVLEAAYDDAQGVTARFTLNILTRINRELGADFDLSAFEHVARWDEAEGRIETVARCVREATVRVPAINMQLAFKTGDSIHIENSHKYTAAQIDAMAEAGGLSVAQRWLDGRGWFSVNLLAPAAGA